MGNIKDILTTVAGIALIVATAIKTYLETLNGGEINWFQLIVAVVVAIIGFFTGRNPDGSSKKNPENV